MDDRDRLARRFEAHRSRLRAVAYRMLGSASEADDAVAPGGAGGPGPARAGRARRGRSRAAGAPGRFGRAGPAGGPGQPDPGRAARQLASRARRRLQGAPAPDADLARQRAVVDAFLVASRQGDFEALVALLHPDAVVRADQAAVRAGADPEVRGAAVEITLLADPDRLGRLELTVLGDGGGPSGCTPVLP